MEDQVKVVQMLEIVQKRLPLVLVTIPMHQIRVVQKHLHQIARLPQQRHSHSSLISILVMTRRKIRVIHTRFVLFIKRTLMYYTGSSDIVHCLFQDVSL